MFSLMRLGTEPAALPGVADAAVVMGTKSNEAILSASGLPNPAIQARYLEPLVLGGGNAIQELAWN